MAGGTLLTVVSDKPVTGISTGAYIQNMTTLIDYLDQAR